MLKLGIFLLSPEKLNVCYLQYFAVSIFQLSYNPVIFLLLIEFSNVFVEKKSRHSNHRKRGLLFTGFDYTNHLVKKYFLHYDSTLFNRIVTFTLDNGVDETDF